MRAEDYATAWTLAGETLAERDPATRDDPALPYHLRWVWDGTAVDGRDVLVRCYHGLGDTLQYARFLPLLAQRAASVTLEAQPRLAALLSGLEGVTRLMPFDVAQPLPPSGCDVEITELPLALRATPDLAPAPYLHATAAPLPPGTVGLCYSAGDWDPARCVPPALLAPLCRTPCVSLVSEPAPFPALNPQGCPFDIDATAALVAGCALVITVDTMIAHLAGALGRPTWLLLKHAPDWRWDPARRDTPWYASMRLYVQPGPDDWGSVVAEVGADLARKPFSGNGVLP